ncbi:MAG TPA: efflux RND transporter periplasmic adaptor subunit [Planctomycetota bacterium]|nr:efflux RND transporter periplasmic adaptor subunit [Planctomycetota bacterium]
MIPTENASTTPPPAAARPPELVLPRPVRKSGSGGAKVLGLLILIALLIGVFLLGYLPRLRQTEELRRDSEKEENRLPEVKVARAVRAPAQVTLTLPGTARAQIETPIYARINGYLKRFLVDLGDTVKKGQLLAEIESPEVDQQLRQARANLAVARAALAQNRANLTLADIGARRWVALAKDHAVSQQEADEKQAALEARHADVQAAEAAIQSQEANVKRYEELQGFMQILAPFDGIISSRSVDIGTLVSEGSTTSTRELYRLVQVDTLRVFVNVPESAMASVQPGLEVQLRFDAHPGRVWAGLVTRTARSADPASRMMQSEVTVANPDGVLSSGLYAQVVFQLKRATPPLLVPAKALVIWPKGSFVAVVGPDSIVHYPAVGIGRDYGTQAEILSGLQEGDRVMVNPTTEVKEGQKVRAVDDQ